MLVISSKSLLPLALAATLAIAVTQQPVLAQAAQGAAAPGAQPQKNWKDRAEYDLYESIGKEQTPAKRLELLNQWKEKYPASEFGDVRAQVYMATYAQVGKPAEALVAACEIMSKEPNNLQALSTALTSVFSLQGPTADQLSCADKAAQQVTSNLETLFGADKKPAGVGDADWTTAKKNMQVLAQNALGFVAWQRKDLEKAEAEFVKSMKLEPNQGQVSYWLSVVILGQKKPEKYSDALWHYARAAAYDGPGSLNAQGRQQVMNTFEKTYITYHGSKEGVEKVIGEAKAGALPPPAYKIKSKGDLAQEMHMKEEDLKKQNPQLAMWKGVKAELTGSGGPAYFESGMKGTKLPELKAKLIEARPEGKVKELVVSIEDGMTPDATLQLETPLAGKMEPGSEIGFQGTATAFTANPFMVTFNVEKADLTGWKGAPAPAPAKAKAKRAAPARKGGSKKR